LDGLAGGKYGFEQQTVHKNILPRIKWLNCWYARGSNQSFLKKTGRDF
jgi:hypothetical protein